MRRWLRSYWQKVEGNALWDFTKWAAGASIGGLALGMYALVQLVRGVPIELRVAVVAFAASAAFGIIAATLSRRRPANPSVLGQIITVPPQVTPLLRTLSIAIDPGAETRAFGYGPIGLTGTDRLCRVIVRNEGAEMVVGARVVLLACEPAGVIGVFRDEPLSAVAGAADGAADIRPRGHQRYDVISEEKLGSIRIRQIAYARRQRREILAMEAGLDDRTHHDIPFGTVLTLKAESVNTEPALISVRVDRDSNGDAVLSLATTPEANWLSAATLGYKQSRDGDLSDVYMELTHRGPTSALKVQAIYVTGAAKTPWAVRWVGSADETKQVISGHPELLHLCRVDAVNTASTAKGARWRPGRFLFCTPTGENEVLMSTEGMLRSSDIHKREIVVTLRIVVVPSGQFTARKIALGINEDLSVRITDRPLQSGD